MFVLSTFPSISGPCVNIKSVFPCTAFPLSRNLQWGFLRWQNVLVLKCPTDHLTFYVFRMMFGAKPSPEPMLVCCQLESWEQISVKFESEFYHLHSRKCVSKCRMWKCRPFFHGRNELRRILNKSRQCWRRSINDSRRNFRCKSWCFHAEYNCS